MGDLSLCKVGSMRVLGGRIVASWRSAHGFGQNAGFGAARLVNGVAGARRGADRPKNFNRSPAPAVFVRVFCCSFFYCVEVCRWVRLYRRVPELQVGPRGFGASV